MKVPQSIALALLVALPPSVAEEDKALQPAATLEVPTRSVGIPWVGLDVGKLDKAMRAHAVKVPQGAGFVVTSVVEGSPADKAGMKSYDILWKFNDQILFNEAQFGSLLGLHQVGDTIQLTVVRSGAHEILDLELAPPPVRDGQPALSPVDIPLVPAGVPGLPRSIVYPQARKAVVSRDDGGTAELRHDDGEAMVIITDGEGGVIYDGPVRKDGKMAVPDDWRCSVGALMRTMHRAEDGEWKARKPRPRVVTPPVVRER